MMTKLLTIGIPTFNRAQLLDKQLTWLAQSINGLESQCEIIISDNCSTDDTQEVIKKWEPDLSKATLRINRNTENIGAVRNIAYCLRVAEGKYVWPISDDDLIFENTLSYVLNTLTKHPELGLLILNFCRRHPVTGELDHKPCYLVENDDVSLNGKSVFEDCAEKDIAGVLLTTAQVYRTDLAKSALKEWVSGFNNLAVQMYWTGYCAAYGSVKVTKETYLAATAGNHFFLKNPRQFFTLIHLDEPELFVKVQKIGYSKNFSKRMLIKRFKQFHWRTILGALRRWPVFTTKTIFHHFELLISVW